VNAITPIERAWHFRDLIRAILSRELASRFRGSVFGWIWAIASPLVMMTAYTVIFSGIIAVSRTTMHQSFGARALMIFSGITIFNFASELLYRGPGLLHEHAGFIKKSIFPTEALAWVAVLRAFVYTAISIGVLLAFKLALTWQLPWTIALMPFLLVPLLMFLLGATWFLMALGAFTRDIIHLMATILPLLMWITPIFYRFDDIPAKIRPWMHINILGDYIDMFRDIVLNGNVPDLQLYGACAAASFAVFVLGYVFFIRYKSIIVDVI
jgi:lipopolysaccharide transport system permease protein